MAEDFAIGRALVIPKDVLSNLDEVDKKINKIATDSENMATKFTSSMSKMSTGTGDLLKRLTEMQTKINNMDISKFAQGVSNVAKGVSQIEKFSNAISKAAAAINKYNSSQVNKKNVDNTKEINRLNKEIEALKKKTEQLEQYRQKQQQVNREQNSTRTNTKAIDAYNRAMASSEAIVTQRINKIAKLRQAEEMLTNASGNYEKQIKRIRQEIERLNKLNQGQVDSYGRVIKSQRNLMDTSGQLARQLALIFSVSQIEGYISKLVRVRGEFELQNTALASILQNKDQADKLFGQITELAVKSPFTVKELTTYTKSLSAYSVEYEKLYDTTKMLADVSAGLGVDMQRLILAFGQVKAANFLRGTETRQFTEAGINMLGELAKYYTELEGRIVSVGEVQERQFKRMISFADVEEVFKRLTSAGGMFYNMQEKQAETLAGMMSNLQDSIDIMLNDIGQSNESVIKGIISFIKSLIDNWKQITQVAEPITSVLVLYLSLTKGWVSISNFLPKIWKSVANSINIALVSITRAEAAQRKFNAATRANAWLTVGAIITTIIWEVVNAIKAANEEQQKLNNIASDGYFNSVKSVAGYKRLADIVSDTTASYKEQEEALEQLNREYGDILSKHYLEADAIRAMKGNYDEATAAIENYIRAKTQEKQLQYIGEEYGGEVNESQNTLAKQIQKQVKSLYDYELKISEINVILAQFRKEFDDGFIKSPTEAKKRIDKLISSRFFDFDVNLGQAAGASLGRIYIDNVSKYYNSLVDLSEKTDEVISGTTLQWADKITLELQEQKKELDNQIKLAESYLNIISKQGEVGRDGSLITQSQVDEAKSKLSELVRQYGIDASYISQLTGDAFQIKKATIDINKAAIKSMINEVSNMKLPKNQIGSALSFIKELKKELNELEESPFQSFISGIIKSSAELNKISLGNLIDAFAKSEETVSDYTKRIEAKLSQLKESIDSFNQSPYLIPEWNLDESNLKLAEKQALVYEDILRRIKRQETKSYGGENKELKRLKDQIALIKKAGDEYEKLRKYYSEEEATAKIRESFKDAFSNLSLSTQMDFDVSGVIKALEELNYKVVKGGKEAVDEVVAPLKAQQDIDVRVKGLSEIQKQLNDVFAGYELSVELEKMGLDNNLISQLFNVDTFSLDDVQKNLDKMKPELIAYGKDGVDIFNNMEKKITEMQQNELQERLKKYASYLKKSVSERVKIEIEAQKEIAKVQATDELTPQQKERVTKNIREEANKKKDEQAWKEFQESDLYIRMFEDLESASTKSLDLMEQKLLSLRDSLKNLSPSDLKEITTQLEKIQELKLERNPFKGFVSNIKELIKYQGQAKELNEQYIESVKQEDLLKSLVENQELAIEKERERYNQAVKINGALSEEANLAKMNVSSQEDLLDVLLKQLVAQGKISKELADKIRNGEEYQDKLVKSLQEISELFSTISTSVLNISDGLQNIFGTFSDKANDTVESISEIASGLSDTFQGASNLAMGIMSNNPIQAIKGGIETIQGLVDTVGAIFQIGDKKKERDIQRQLELVENLENAYERLEKAIDNAYSMDTYRAATNAANKNLEEQNKALEAAIAAEKSKKKVDEDRIKELEQQMQDNAELMEENLEQQFSTFTAGVFDDVISAADTFVDAWLEAFKETGDGISGLEDSFQEMLLNIVKRQVAMSVISPFIEDIKNAVEQLMGNENLSTDDVSKVVDAAKSKIPELSEALESIFKAFQQAGLELESADYEMSGLQKGISSITEETAEVLASITESIRYFTSDSNNVLHNIYNAITMPNVENPFLSELKIQSSYLLAISSLLNSVSKNVQSNGKVLKVQIV